MSLIFRRGGGGRRSARRGNWGVTERRRGPPELERPAKGWSLGLHHGGEKAVLCGGGVGSGGSRVAGRHSGAWVGVARTPLEKKMAMSEVGSLLQGGS